MEKSKLCCDVCSCCHNVNGCECDKNCIAVTTGKENGTAHYCADYEE